MKHYQSAIIILLVLLYSGVYAFKWEEKKLKVLDTTTEQLKTKVKLQDNDGRIFSVTHFEAVDPAAVSKIIELKDQIFQWKTIKIENLEFIIPSGNADSLDVMIYPKGIDFQGQNLKQYLPAGMLLYYSDELRYDFRVLFNNQSFKVKGKYSTEEELLSRMHSLINSGGQKKEEGIKQNYQIDQVSPLKKEPVVSLNVDESFYHGPRVFFGSGNLAAVGYYLSYWKLEAVLSSGFTMNKGNARDIYSVPVGAKLQYNIVNLIFFQPYVNAGLLDYIPVKGADKAKMYVIGGLGGYLFTNFFGEVSYIFDKDASMLIIGFGTRLKF